MSSRRTFCNLEPAGNGLLVLTMSSADGQQCLTEQAVADLVKTLTRVRDDPNARGLVTTCKAGDGIHYAASGKADEAAGMAEVIRLLMELPMPTVAAVCGHATSLGVALALAHDHMVVWGPAELRLPEGPELLPDYAGTLLREKLPPAELQKMSRPCTGDQLVSGGCHSVNGRKRAVLSDALELLDDALLSDQGADFAKARQAKCPETWAHVGSLPRPPSSSHHQSSAQEEGGREAHHIHGTSAQSNERSRLQRFQRANGKQITHRKELSGATVVRRRF